jgi:hypothetical protein
VELILFAWRGEEMKLITLMQLLAAIAMVETGGVDTPNAALGDGGASLGVYQISRAYWQDAVDYCPKLGGTYKDVRDPEYAKKVMVAYWEKYLHPDEWTVENLAMCHNGGGGFPKKRGASKKRMEEYARRVQEALEKITGRTVPLDAPVLDPEARAASVDASDRRAPSGAAPPAE